MERLSRDDRRRDPYRSSSKPLHTAHCPVCHAMNVKGRWESPKEFHTTAPRGKLVAASSVAERNTAMLCPACRQLKERYAMGIVELRGNQWRQNAEQVFATIQNSVAIAQSRNNQHRLLWSEDDGKGITRVFVTMPEVARHIARTLVHTFKGELKYERDSEGGLLRVTWCSEPAENLASPQHRSKSWRGRGRTNLHPGVPTPKSVRKSPARGTKTA